MYIILTKFNVHNYIYLIFIYYFILNIYYIGILLLKVYYNMLKAECFGRLSTK